MIRRLMRWWIRIRIWLFNISNDELIIIKLYIVYLLMIILE